MENRASKLGILGENEAVNFLVNKGYRILHRNWRCGKDELDVVAMNEDILVFIEVKTRTGTAFGQPWESVDARKEEALYRVAAAYIEHFKIDCDVRFDIISIVVSPGMDFWIDHIENAFGT